MDYKPIEPGYMGTIAMSRIDRPHVSPPFIDAALWAASVERDEREQDRRYRERMTRSTDRSSNTTPTN